MAWRDVVLYLLLMKRIGPMKWKNAVSAVAQSGVPYFGNGSEVVGGGVAPPTFEVTWWVAQRLEC